MLFSFELRFFVFGCLPFGLFTVRFLNRRSLTILQTLCQPVFVDSIDYLSLKI